MKTRHKTVLLAHGNGTGVTVGVDTAPYGPERTLVHGGTQFLFLTYDNTASPYYSQTDRTCGGRALTALSLRGHGRWGSPNGFTFANGTYTATGSGLDLWNTARPVSLWGPRRRRMETRTR